MSDADQEGGASPSCAAVADQHRLSGQVARLLARCASCADDALGNSQRANAFERARNVDKIGKPVDRSEWGMTPPTVNAYYSPDREQHQLPRRHPAAAVLSAPAATRRVNYGGAGAVIGHELTHGFDDQGRKFDAQGQPARLVDGGRRRRRSRSARTCIVDQYSGYAVAGDANVNGR